MKLNMWHRLVHASFNDRLSSTFQWSGRALRSAGGRWSRVDISRAPDEVTADVLGTSHRRRIIKSLGNRACDQGDQRGGEYAFMAGSELWKCESEPWRNAFLITISVPLWFTVWWGICICSGVSGGHFRSLAQRTKTLFTQFCFWIHIFATPFC